MPFMWPNGLNWCLCVACWHVLSQWVFSGCMWHHHCFSNDLIDECSPIGLNYLLLCVFAWTSVTAQISIGVVFCFFLSEQTVCGASVCLYCCYPLYFRLSVVIGALSTSYHSDWLFSQGSWPSRWVYSVCLDPSFLYTQASLNCFKYIHTH